MKHALYILALLFLFVTTGCDHKDLCYQENHSLLINVVFDWRNAPEANPESMVLRMYNRNDGSTLRYVFQGKDGGTIKVPYGTYDAICINGDINNWAHLRNTDEIDTYEVFTSDATELRSLGVPVTAVSRADDSGQQRMAEPPHNILYTDRQDKIDLPVTTTQKTVTLYPDDKLCHYTVDIYDVENTQALQGSAVDGVLSGMAEGLLIGEKSSTDTPVSMPFVMQATDNSSLHSEFLTFGEPAHGTNSHKLTVYIMLTDGSQWSQSFDVSQQIYDASDPRHVHIILHGMKLPTPINHSGGIQPDVNGWVSEKIDLKM